MHPYVLNHRLLDKEGETFHGYFVLRVLALMYLKGDGEESFPKQHVYDEHPGYDWGISQGIENLLKLGLIREEDDEIHMSDRLLQAFVPWEQGMRLADLG